MNFGLVGWGIASGNGGMNSDLASLSDWITHWLVAEHPNGSCHQPYLDKAEKNTRIIHSKLDDITAVRSFLEEVDGIIYIEHPCFRDKVDIVSIAKSLGKFVAGIPMWEWWPMHKSWALQTDFLWSVTDFTNQYLTSLGTVLETQGYQPNWLNNVEGNRWGVDLKDFSFSQRHRANRFVFVNGNGGYKLRKASDIVFDAFSREGAPPLTVYTQQSERIATSISSNITLVEKNFPSRAEVYAEGDVFLFPSYWEGLCHGIYEAQACGGIVITSSQAPMSECGTPYLLPIVEKTQENLAGNRILKSKVSALDLYNISKYLFTKDITMESINNRSNIVNNFSLAETLKILYSSLLNSNIGYIK